MLSLIFFVHSMKNSSLLLVVMLLCSFSCKNKQNADLILHNGMVYTVDSAFSVAEAFAVKDGKIIAVGTNEEILDNFRSDSVIDAGGKAVYPGFIDAHCHFYGYGTNLTKVDLSDCTSENEMFSRVEQWADNNPEGWILGRGWDQNEWPQKVFPDKSGLDSLFPDRPVYLTRVDGHAALVNTAAMKMAGISSATKISGGVVELKGGSPSGILIDNAMDLVYSKIPQPTEEQSEDALLKAQQNCFAVGLTTVDDAGLPLRIVKLIEKMQDAGTLKMRIYAMLDPTEENFQAFRKPLIQDRLSVRSFKIYADGALGSRGAWLLEPYSDDAKNSGLLLQDTGYYYLWAERCSKNGFQLNVHAIGDAANQLMLTVFARYNERSKDLRWRIEHAQVIAETDFDLFGNYGIIPSVQPTHATSDMSWAGDRLGSRVKNAYAYRRLMQQNGWIPLGTDFPVENINPMFTFFAAVARQNEDCMPEGGFQITDALSRKEALRGMTIWAAMANFEEKQKGSIEVGKVADFVILDRDIMKCQIREARDAKVLRTVLNGETVYAVESFKVESF